MSSEETGREGRQVELHGHRGARGLFPENTIEGFAGALGVGVDVLELDVGVTADDVVTVTHDPALNPDITRTADGVWLRGEGPLIRSLPSAALASYDVGRIRPGSQYARLYPTQVPVDGARIRPLSEVLARFPDISFNIEVKTFPLRPGLTVEGPVLADLTLAVVERARAFSRIILQAFDWRVLRRVRSVRPELALAWLTSGSTVAKARQWWDGPHPGDFGGSVPRAVAAEGGPTWSPDYRSLTAEQVSEAHELGLRVMPWTVNQASDMERCLAWGVDGLITDWPDRARSVFAAQGLPLPPVRPGA